MFQATEHHPVADVGYAQFGGGGELLDDRVGAAEVEALHEAVVIQLTVVGANLHLAVDHLEAVEGATGPVLPAGVGQLLAGFIVGFRNVGDGLEAQFQAVVGLAQVLAGVNQGGVVGLDPGAAQQAGGQGHHVPLGSHIHGFDTGARDPEGGMGLLQRLGPNGGGVGHLDEFAVVGKGLVLGPGLDEHVHTFVKLLAGVLQGNAETGHFVGLISAPHAADETAVNQIVQDSNLFSQAQDIPDGHHYNAGGNLESLGPLPDVEGLHEGSGGIAVVGEMVLGNQAVFEAHFFRVLNLLYTLLEEGFPVAQVGVGPFVEEAKLHEAKLLVGLLINAGEFSDWRG